MHAIVRHPEFGFINVDVVEWTLTSIVAQRTDPRDGYLFGPTRFTQKDFRVLSTNYDPYMDIDDAIKSMEESAEPLIEIV